MTRRSEQSSASFQQIALQWVSSNTTLLMRVALGVVFLWFGALKFCHGLCDIEALAGKTLTLLTFGRVPETVCLYILAAWECLIGIGLITGRFRKLTIVLLLTHLSGTFLPLVLFPAETWKYFPYAPTLAGQYILKNVVLLAGALVVGVSAVPETEQSSAADVIPMQASAEFVG